MMGVSCSGNSRGIEPGGVLEEIAERQQADAAVAAVGATFERFAPLGKVLLGAAADGAGAEL
ncbi:MAG TPA: hypothetical protein PK867_08630 [Pirellulales bacterium]|nr:hypothetical protein [Pirellulales bacterium]